MSESAPAQPDWPPASQPEQGPSRVTIAAGLIIAAVLICALYFAREVLIPITLATLLTFILAPFVNVMRRIYIPRVPAIVAAVLLGLVIIIGVGTLIGTQIANLAGQLPEYQATIETKLSHVRDTVLSPLMRAAARFESQSHQNPDNSAHEAGSKPGETAPQPIPVQVQQPPLSPLQIGERVITPILHPVATIVIMLVVTIFALMYKEDLRDRAIRLFGSGDLNRTTKAMDDAAQRLGRYFLTQLAINCAFGIVSHRHLFHRRPAPDPLGRAGSCASICPLRRRVAGCCPANSGRCCDQSGLGDFTELALEAAEQKPTLAPASTELERISASNEVLCLPGRGPFDQIATLLLSQLFRQHGLAAMNSFHEAASRRKVGSLELKNIAVVSVLYLELSGTPAHVRFLVRRLKERNSQTKLILGLLQKGSTATSEQTAKLGADEYVSSLEGALSATANFLTHSPETTCVD
jgi:hypothetical protein